MKVKKALFYAAPVALAGFLYLGEATGIGEVLAKTVTTVVKTLMKGDYIGETVTKGTLDDKYIYGEKFEVIFRNGYSKNSPSIKCLVEFQKDFGHTMWGAELNKIYYVLKILSVEEIK